MRLLQLKKEEEKKTPAFLPFFWTLSLLSKLFATLKNWSAILFINLYLIGLSSTCSFS